MYALALTLCLAVLEPKATALIHLTHCPGLGPVWGESDTRTRTQTVRLLATAGVSERERVAFVAFAVASTSFVQGEGQSGREDGEGEGDEAKEVIQEQNAQQKRHLRAPKSHQIGTPRSYQP